MMQLLRIADYAQTRWRNGAGTSLEIAARGVPGEAFAWRLSMAHIARPGPFSDYEGYERVTALIEGEGFTLRRAGAAELRFTQVGQCHAYAGSPPYSCELHAGPCRDLNLIARQGIGASMSVVAVEATGLELGRSMAVRYLVPLSGAVSVQAAATSMRPGRWDAVVLAAGECARVAVEGAGMALVALASIPS
jgi:uncharacterized protein